LFLLGGNAIIITVKEEHRKKMTELSPSAQAVLNAAYAPPLKNGQPNIAAAIRAVAMEVVLNKYQYAEWEMADMIMQEMQALADELDSTTTEPMTDLHTLIRRMADELDLHHQHMLDDRTARHSLAAEARAALARWGRPHRFLLTT
jgi:hypothetical protein